MRRVRPLRGESGGIAGALYGTIIVMATIAAGSGAQTDASRLAAIVTTTVLVLWVAHVYSHVIAESLEQERRLDRAEFIAVAGREWSMVAAAIAPVTILVLGALGVFEERTAIRLALGVGVATLAVAGWRYATLERLGHAGTIVAVTVNVVLGLLIVALEVLLAH
jgi:hypothetical protein